MPWPSKNPDDYYEPSLWDDDPPRLLERLRGRPDPDPVPVRYRLVATVCGLAVAAATTALTDANAFLFLWSVVLAGIVLDVGWWLTRKRRQRAPAPTPR